MGSDPKDRDWDYFNSDEDDSSSSSESLSSLLESAKAAVHLVYTMSEIEHRNEERKRQREAREKRHQFYSHHWKAILAVFLSLIIIAASVFGIWYYRKLIPVGYSSDGLKGIPNNQVTFLLSEAGYTDITVEELFDLSLQNENQAGLVAQVSINDNCTFTETDRFPYDSDVVVYVHSLKLVSPPFSHKEARKSDYATVLSQLKTAGFVSIESEPIYDVVLGWFAKDGDIESVTIGGSTEFDSSATYRPDIEAIISYHTLKKNANGGS